MFSILSVPPFNNGTIWSSVILYFALPKEILDDAKKAEEKALAAKKIADEKKAADKKIADKKAAEAKKAQK